MTKDPAMFVVDNSVILKVILKEEDSEIARKLLLLKEKFEISLLVPDLFRYEFFNKLTKAANAKVAMEAWEAFVERQVSIVPFEVDLVEIANKLIEKYPKISFYDASYHALAKAYRIDLITADEKYHEMTKKEGNIKLLCDLKI